MICMQRSCDLHVIGKEGVRAGLWEWSNRSHTSRFPFCLQTMIEDQREREKEAHQGEMGIECG